MDKNAKITLAIGVPSILFTLLFAWVVTSGITSLFNIGNEDTETEVTEQIDWGAVFEEQFVEDEKARREASDIFLETRELDVDFEDAYNRGILFTNWSQGIDADSRIETLSLVEGEFEKMNPYVKGVSFVVYRNGLNVILIEKISKDINGWDFVSETWVEDLVETDQAITIAIRTWDAGYGESHVYVLDLNTLTVENNK